MATTNYFNPYTREGSIKDQYYYDFMGQPVPLYWGGWKSDTHTLKREGWEFYVHDEYDTPLDRMCVYISATSREKDFSIAGRYMQYQGSYTEFIHRVYYEGFRMQEFITLRSEVVVQDLDMVNAWIKMEKVDVFEPVRYNTRNYRAKDFKIFARQPEDKINEIYIPSNSVDECLNRILQLQYPEQQKIKSSILMPEAKPIIQAKILSLAI